MPRYSNDPYWTTARYAGVCASTGLLTPPGEPSIHHYRELTTDEKRDLVRLYVRFNLRCGCVGRVRCAAVDDAVSSIWQWQLDEQLTVRAAFRASWSATRKDSAL